MSPSDQERRNADSAVSDLVKQIERQGGARRLSPEAVINPIRLQGRSVTVADTQLEIVVAVHDVADAGSFTPGSCPSAVDFTIYPFPEGLTGSEAIRDGASTPIADAEGEAWLRVVLGDELADYAYQLHTIIQPRGHRKALHPHQKIFASFTDGRDHHILAPDNFTWQRLSHTSQQLPRKIEPSTHNTRLIELLATSGPFADAELVRDLRTNPDGTWRIQLAGDDLDHLTPVAREALEHAYRLFRIRGAIHTSLRPERLIATPQEVQLHFRWQRNPNTFAITTELPQTETAFHPPASNPAAWMSYRASDWDEELSTGWVRWAQRTRIDGVIHLGRRQELTHGGYSSNGHLQPRPDTDGNVSIPHGDNLAMDTTATYRASKLIAWNHEIDVRQKGYTFAAHAVVVWTDTLGVASLDILEGLPTTPDYSFRRAAFHAIHDAADAGAHLITTTLTTPLLNELGFTTDRTGRLSLDVLQMP